MVESSKRYTIKIEDIRTQEEIMDYFTRQVLDAGSGGNRDSTDSSSRGSTGGESSEVAITDAFGFVEKTIGEGDTTRSSSKVFVKKLDLKHDAVLS